MKRAEERKGNALVAFRGYDKLSHDPRNDLVLRFLEVAQVLHPRTIVVENVPQFLSHFHNGKRGGIMMEVQDLLGAMGYEVVCDILNAADYGVPQLRERAVIIASRVGKIGMPDPTHTSGADLLQAARPLKPWTTVQEALMDLPEPPVSAVDHLGGGPLSLYGKTSPSAYAELMRTAPSFPFNHISRTYSKNVTAIISHMKQGETWDDASERMRKKYERLIDKARLSGEDPAKTQQRLAKNGDIIPAFFKDYYWSAYTRLALDKPALTITANANFLGSGRFTHPLAHRGITMREAARLQSFDDAFRFITSEGPGGETTTIGVGLDMIGEAVPPLLAEAVADCISAALDKISIGRSAATSGQQKDKHNRGLRTALAPR